MRHKKGRLLEIALCFANKYFEPMNAGLGAKHVAVTCSLKPLDLFGAAASLSRFIFRIPDNFVSLHLFA
jgi:hypothetical protein